jgi:hypothetical protein
MAIADSELNRDFILVDEHTTVRQVRDEVGATGNEWTYIVVRLDTGQYVVLRLNELVEALKGWLGKTLLQRMLDAALSIVPGLLAPRAVDGVEAVAMETGAAKRLARKVPGKRLVVLADGQVVGVLEGLRLREFPGVGMDWLRQAPGFVEESGFVAIPKSPGVLGLKQPEETTEEPSPSPEPEPENRWINTEIEDHDRDKPLKMGEVYTLAFDVDTQVRATSLVTGAAFDYQFAEGEQMVVLTVQLESDDFEIYTGPQKLRVPRTGKSKGKARFDVEPKHEGGGIINAVFLKDGNFIQIITLKLYTGALFSSETLGRAVDAAFAVQPRDVNLTILNTGAGFQVIMSGAVGAMATLPITLPELDQWITEVRGLLRDEIVYKKGPDRTYVYQGGIDIPPEVNRVALQRLARAGFRLYQRIFYGPAADAQASVLGDRLRQMAQQERLKIQIFSQQFMLPWGILYMAGEDEYDPDNIDPEMFLGLKHVIEHIPLQPDMQVTNRTIDSHPRLDIGLNVNTDIDTQVKRPVVAEQQAYWDKIRQGGLVEVRLRQTGDEVVRALADTSNSDQVLYFYCHAASKSLAEGGGPDASTLVLSGNKSLALGDLYIDAPRKKTLPGAPLVFINACESAELSPLFYDGFVPYFMAKGARGVIGTECETPALFAAEWARRFFDRFLAGESLGQVFLDLRREFYYEHNNLLGLLYALYVDGDTHIAPAVQAT